ncbi:MAG: ACT domain-containing protein [Elusimicrobia bacterium]|nr:ACT domain-containing protein [Elusimicrobiota bacterium]
MKTINQLSIFIENTKGRLAEVCKLLGDNGINIKALTIAETPEFGILRVVLDDAEIAKKILKENNFIATSASVVAVEVSDTPGGLAKALKVLAENDINLEYMYGFVEKASEQALMVFKFDNMEKGIEVLQKNNISIVEEKVALGK